MTDSIRNRQCAACPWRKGAVPERDIPRGYSRALHEGLACTIATPGEFRGVTLRVMACHDSPTGAEQPCVGWVAHQLGPGNNLALRLSARDGRYRNLRTDGPQHERFEDTLPKARQARGR